MTLIKILALPFCVVILFALLGSYVSHAAVPAGKCLLYVGTYTNVGSKGIYLYNMDLATGRLSPMGLAAETPNPTFLDLDAQGKFLYVANEIDSFDGQPSGAVSAFSIARGTGKLTLLNQRSSKGGGPCHILLDHSGKNVLVANYGGGSMAVLPIQPDGRLGEATAFMQHQGKSINPERQEKPHAHCVALDAANRFAFVCDLGTDKIMIYRFDPAQGTLSPAARSFAAVKPGAGPRHLAFHPDGRHAYLINELSSSVTVLTYDAEQGTLQGLQSISTLPGDFRGQDIAAEITVHPSGKFLYTSNRGHDSITVFGIDSQKGTLTFVECQATQGKNPRHFGIDPTGNYLIAANQDSNNLVVFAINSETGKLKSTGQVLELPSPVCVKFLPLAAK